MPVGCSLLHMGEILFGIITRRAIGATFRFVKNLPPPPGSFIDAHNDGYQPSTKAKDADELLARIGPSSY